MNPETHKPKMVFRIGLPFGAWMPAIALALCVTPGCANKEAAVIVSTALPEPLVFAVAPVLNFTGAQDFDPERAADLLASELTFVEGATVLPVSRVMAVLAAQGKSQVESPAHALAVAREVGADAIVVAGVTEYDAYIPIMGVAMQLYRLGRAADEGFDAQATSRAARPVSLAGREPGSPAIFAQTQVIYNGAHAHVADLVKVYAQRRQEELQMGWRQYLKVQTLFIRFCWHDALLRLLSRQPYADARFADVETMEIPE